MALIQYKAVEGVLHIGGGRFFPAQKPIKVSGDEAETLLKKHSDLELVESEEQISDDIAENDKNKPDNKSLGQVYTKTSIKKLKAEEQRELIEKLGGNPDETNNEDERISLILKLQENKG